VPIVRLGRKTKPKGFWKDIDNMRQFFLDFAAKKGFDPYDAQTWRKVTYKELSKNGNFVRDIPFPVLSSLILTFPHCCRKISSIRARTEGKVHKALSLCFPGMTFERTSSHFFALSINLRHSLDTLCLHQNRESRT